jgi:alanine-synthesizing transaminase
VSEIPAASRTSRLTYAIRNIAAAASRLEAEGRRVLYLNIGDPLLYDFETPPAMIEAVAKAMRDGKNYYGPSAGVLVAREAVAESLERQGVSCAPGDVFMTSGASEAIEIALSALVEPGENVLTPVPGYPLYSAVLAKLGAVERGYRLNPAANWEPDLAHLESVIDPATRAIVVINPNNPTGSVCDADTLARVVEIARRHNLVVLADEVYHSFTYDKPSVRLAAIAGDVPVIAFDSLSKANLATGWRCGWMSLHNTGRMPGVRAALGKLLDARLCSPTAPQFAVETALLGDQSHVEQAKVRLRERRDLTVRRLGEIPGVSCCEPEAAFYVMAKFDGLGGGTDEQFVLDLLAREAVLTVHGSGFGLDPRDGYLRIVYLPAPAVLEAAYAGLARVAEAWTSRSSGVAG